MRGILRYDCGMTLELSDKFERMDKCFRDKVQKTHFDVLNLMELYTMYKINPKAPEIRNKVISKIIMKENCDKNPFFKCEMCYTLLPRKEMLYKHIWKYHDNENLGK